MQPFGSNRYGPKIGGGLCPFGGGGVWSPSNTMWRGSRRTCMPSFILMHPTVWPQYANVTDRTGQVNCLIALHRANRFTNGRPKTQFWIAIKTKVLGNQWTRHTVNSSHVTRSLFINSSQVTSSPLHLTADMKLAKIMYERFYIGLMIF